MWALRLYHSTIGKKVIEVQLTPDEKAALQKSADAVREPMAAVKM